MIAAVTLMLATATPVQSLAEAYLEALWKTSPMTATQVGHHAGGASAKLDDLSPAARARRIAWLRDFRARLDAAKPADAEERADAALLRHAVALELVDLVEIRDFERRCDVPLQALGSVFFTMAARPHGDPARRRADANARLAAVGSYLAQAKAALTTDVEIYRAAARDDGAGLLAYLEKDLPRAIPGVDPKPAAAAVRAYLRFVDRELPKKPKGTFRAGAERYARRFGPYLQTELTPAQVLAAAERRMAELHEEMKALAKKIVPSGDVREALARVADDHAAPSELFQSVRAQLDRARAFVRAQKLLTLAGRDNLQVIETPPFLRAQLGVAAFDGAPPLVPELGAFYYVTPFPADWPPSKVDAKLREYNRFMLELITIHEAMPGHYAQFERANAITPETRRVLRWLLGANAYIEGWAVYAQDVMVDAGYLGGDPRLRLQQAKLELRSVANAILDIKLHTAELPDEAALALLTEKAFQERPEAELKLRRAKLSTTQLCAYFVGGEAWRALRREAEKRPGFDARTFHDRALAEGAVTMASLRELLGLTP